MAGAAACRMRRVQISVKVRRAQLRQLGHPEDFGILPSGFRMRQHTCKVGFSTVREGRMRDSQTVLLLTQHVKAGHTERAPCMSSIRDSVMSPIQEERTQS